MSEPDEAGKPVPKAGDVVAGKGLVGTFDHPAVETRDICGNPPPPKPAQRASAEGAPPLSLPAAPMRETEKKLSGPEVAARPAAPSPAAAFEPAKEAKAKSGGGVLGKLVTDSEFRQLRTQAESAPAAAIAAPDGKEVVLGEKRTEEFGIPADEARWKAGEAGSNRQDELTTNGGSASVAAGLGGEKAGLKGPASDSIEHRAFGAKGLGATPKPEEKPAFVRVPSEQPGEAMKLYDVGDITLQIKDFPGDLKKLQSKAQEIARMDSQYLADRNLQRMKKLGTAVKNMEARIEQLDDAQGKDELHGKTAATLDKMAKDLNGFKEIPACNELVQKLREVSEEAKQAAGSDSNKQASETAAKREESIRSGLKDIKERIADAEMWLTQAPTDASTILQQKLQQKISFDFVETPVQDVVTFLKQVSNTDIVLDGKAIAALPNSEVTLKVTDMSLAQALDWITRMVGLEYKTANGRIELTAPKSELVEQPVVELPAASTFKAYPPNPFVMTQKDRFSTFGLDVDTASYVLARNYIRSGKLPPSASVRPEEFINAFDYNYPKQTGQVFAVNAEGMPSPFREGLVLLKVGIQGKVIGRDGRKPAHLVFVIDTSGSMARADRLPLVQDALAALVSSLQPADRVSIVTYATDARLVLQAQPVSAGSEITNAVNAIQCGGSTNLLQGIELGYEVAESAFRAGETNRVILCSDGVANVGLTDAEEMLRQVEQYKRQGISFMSVGFGMGSYNDELMQKLANRGDGSYVFIDTAAEARRVMTEQIAATLQTIAKDAKIQVEFNPASVRRYRLIGYEKRDIADEDFRNDAIDAGEVGSGQSSTALYEIELLDPGNSLDLGTVFVRYRNAESDEVEEISTRLEPSIVANREAEEAPRLYLAAGVAQFAEILRESEHSRGGSLDAVRRILGEVAVQLPLDQRVREVLSMVESAKGL
ncbi:MAG TPA: von Willebrand factor type A domain-containing protein, partial [Phycisphaerae bacterium]|nr:von Willebrand factor type A domain-containing protein [Phycisphaerae bacterium]